MDRSWNRLPTIIQGGMGVAAGGNINPGNQYPSMFEPIHGSAPDIAGRGIANPLAMIWSGSMMLDFLGERDKAERIESAVARVISEGTKRTYDMGGSSSTLEMANVIADNL